MVRITSPLAVIGLLAVVALPWHSGPRGSHQRQIVMLCELWQSRLSVLLASPPPPPPFGAVLIPCMSRSAIVVSPPRRVSRGTREGSRGKLWCRQERQVNRVVVQRGAERQQHAGGAGAQVHRHPQQVLAGEGQAAAVRERVPGHVAYVHGGPRVALPGEVEQHPGASAEQPGLGVVPREGRRAYLGLRLAEAFVLAVGEVVVDDHPDPDAAPREVGQDA